MKKLLLVALIACSDPCFAENLGKAAQTYPVTEQDLAEVFKQRAQARVKDGSWGKVMDQQAEKAKSYAANPQGIHLPRALTYRAFYFDPTVTLEDDIRGAEGQVLWPRGTRVNPLDYITYRKTLCFFDGADKRQVAWLQGKCLDPVKSKAIAVNGPVLKLNEELQTMIYFDQHGALSQRFKLRALPSVVRQTGKVFAVEEFPTK